MQPLVTVLMISYRHFERYLETLDTVFAQDYPHIELILQDDGSENFEEYAAELRAYVSAHVGENIATWSLTSLAQNMGTVRGLNLALASTHGEYLYITSPGDGFCDAGALSRMVAALEQSGLDLLAARVWRESSQHTRTICPGDARWQYLKELTAKELHAVLLTANVFAAQGLLRRTAALRAAAGFDERFRLVEDYTSLLRHTEAAPVFLLDAPCAVAEVGTGVSARDSVPGALYLADCEAVCHLLKEPVDYRYGALQPVYRSLSRAIDYGIFARCRTLTQKGGSALRVRLLFFWYRFLCGVRSALFAPVPGKPHLPR